MEGFLLKQGVKKLIDPSPAWRKRWTVLDPANFRLVYSKKPESRSPKGFIDLRQMTGFVFRRDNFGLFPDKEAVGFQISTPDRTWNLIAESSSDLLNWRRAIESVYLASQTPSLRASTHSRASTTKPRSIFRLTRHRTSSERLPAEPPAPSGAKLGSVSPQTSGLLDLLLSPEHLWPFWTFLEHIHSSENLGFWLETYSMRSCEASYVPTRIAQIARKYLSDNAPWEINVDYAARCKAHRLCFPAVGAPSAAVLDDLLNLVENLLTNDSILKFRNFRKGGAAAQSNLPTLPSVGLIYQVLRHPVLGLPVGSVQVQGRTHHGCFSGLLLWEWFVRTFQEYDILTEADSIEMCHNLFRSASIQDVEAKAQLFDISLYYRFPQSPSQQIAYLLLSPLPAITRSHREHLLPLLHFAFDHPRYFNYLLQSMFSKPYYYPHVCAALLRVAEQCLQAEHLVSSILRHRIDEASFLPSDSAFEKVSYFLLSPRAACFHILRAFLTLRIHVYLPQFLRAFSDPIHSILGDSAAVATIRQSFGSNPSAPQPASLTKPGSSCPDSLSEGSSSSDESLPTSSAGLHEYLKTILFRLVNLLPSLPVELVMVLRASFSALQERLPAIASQVFGALVHFIFFESILLSPYETTLLSSPDNSLLSEILFQLLTQPLNPLVHSIRLSISPSSDDPDFLSILITNLMTPTTMESSSSSSSPQPDPSPIDPPDRMQLLLECSSVDLETLRSLLAEQALIIDTLVHADMWNPNPINSQHDTQFVSLLSPYLPLGLYDNLLSDPSLTSPGAVGLFLFEDASKPHTDITIQGSMLCAYFSLTIMYCNLAGIPITIEQIPNAAPTLPSATASTPSSHDCDVRCSYLVRDISIEDAEQFTELSSALHHLYKKYALSPRFCPCAATQCCANASTNSEWQSILELLLNVANLLHSYILYRLSQFVAVSFVTDFPPLPPDLVSRCEQSMRHCNMLMEDLPTMTQSSQPPLLLELALHLIIRLAPDLLSLDVDVAFPHLTNAQKDFQTNSPLKLDLFLHELTSFVSYHQTRLLCASLPTVSLDYVINQEDQCAFAKEIVGLFRLLELPIRPPFNGDPPKLELLFHHRDHSYSSSHSLLVFAVSSSIWPRSIVSIVLSDLQQHAGKSTLITFSHFNMQEAQVSIFKSFWRKFWIAYFPDGVLLDRLSFRYLLSNIRPSAGMSLLFDAAFLSGITRSKCEITPHSKSKLFLFDGAIQGWISDIKSKPSRCAQRWRNNSHPKFHSSLIMYTLQDSQRHLAISNPLLWNKPPMDPSAPNALSPAPSFATAPSLDGNIPVQKQSKCTEINIQFELVPRQCMKDLVRVVQTKLFGRFPNCFPVDSYTISVITMSQRPNEFYQKFLDKTRLSDSESYGIGAPWGISGVNLGLTLQLDPPHFISRSCQSSVFKLLSGPSDNSEPDTEVTFSFSKLPYGTGTLLQVNHPHVIRESLQLARDMWNPLWDLLGASVVESTPHVQSVSLRSYSVTDILEIFTNPNTLSSLIKSPARVALDEENHRVWLFNDVLEISIKKKPHCVDMRSQSERIFLWRSSAWPKHLYAITELKIERITPLPPALYAGVFLCLSHSQMLSKAKKTTLNLWESFLSGLVAADSEQCTLTEK